MLSLAQVQIQDGGKNVKIIVSGFIEPELDESVLLLLDLNKLSGNPRGIRLDSIVWVIEEKALLYLCWGERVLMPMESRNSVRFDTPLNSPPDIREIRVYCRRPAASPSAAAFFLLLDLDKQ